MVRGRERWMLAAVCCVLAACGTDGAGVRAVQANIVPTTVVTVLSTDPPPPVETTPESAVPDTAVPDTAPDTTPDTSEPPTPTTLPAPSPDGIGDVLFPHLGNPGIDVQNYLVQLAYDKTVDAIDATVTLTITATQDRPTFTLDAVGLDVKTVTVDGTAAPFTVEPQELRITPATPLLTGTTFSTVVAYHVDPTTKTGADGIPIGWFNTDGGSYVLNEPDGARTWLPSDDHPSDKATWRFEITVAAPDTAVANGELVSHTDNTWVWEQRQPMATYLVQLLTGNYEIVTATGPNGLPLVSAVIAGSKPEWQSALDEMGDEITFYSGLFGPYPLDRYGIAVTDSFSGLAMETQGRSMFSRDDVGFALAHELAHQWFGDAVTLGAWRDIWLNESFATYADWLFQTRNDLAKTSALAEQALAQRSDIPTGDPDEANLFAFNAYDGGAVVLHALRLTIGDDKFFTLLKRWMSDNAGKSATTADFIALANHVSGTDLAAFFQTWLFAAKVPDKLPVSGR